MFIDVIDERRELCVWGAKLYTVEFVWWRIILYIYIYIYICI